MRLAPSFLLSALLATSVQAISKVSRAGRYLYSDDGSRFYIKGVAYQEQGMFYAFSPPLPLLGTFQLTRIFSGAVVADENSPFSEPSTFIDPLANSTACARDLPFLQQLNVNTIRVYSVNSSLNHDDCMNALSSAGIYTMFARFPIPAHFGRTKTDPAFIVLI